MEQGPIASAKIVCVSANPAMDRRVYVDTLIPGEVNRGRNSLAMPGGKAAHVAMAARSLGIDADRGTLEAGKRADLLILDADPLARVENVRSIRAVYKGGNPIALSRE